MTVYLCHEKKLVWLINRSLTGTNSSGQSRHESNDNKWLLHIPSNSSSGVSTTDKVWSRTHEISFEWVEGILLFRRGRNQRVLSPTDRASQVWTLNAELKRLRKLMD